MSVRFRVLVATPHRGERMTVQCCACGRYFWPTAAELFRWTACAHCVGWWTFECATSASKQDEQSV